MKICLDKKRKLLEKLTFLYFCSLPISFMSHRLPTKSHKIIRILYIIAMNSIILELFENKQQLRWRLEKTQIPENTHRIKSLKNYFVKYSQTYPTKTCSSIGKRNNLLKPIIQRITCQINSKTASINCSPLKSYNGVYGKKILDYVIK